MDETHDRKNALIYTTKSTRCTLETILLIYSEICIRTDRRWNTRVFLRRHICICVQVPRCQPPPTRYERRGTGRGVRSLNFDPEMATARPLCAWPSTTGRRSTCIWHTIDEMGNEREEVAFLSEKRPLSTSRVAHFSILTILCRILNNFTQSVFSRKNRNVLWLYKEDQMKNEKF